MLSTRRNDLRTNIIPHNMASSNETTFLVGTTSIAFIIIPGCSYLFPALVGQDNVRCGCCFRDDFVDIHTINASSVMSGMSYIS